MKVLLDENFPLALHRSLTAAGEVVDHIITLGLRGASDRLIREQLFDRDVLFLTQDEDFLFDHPTEAVILLSRVRQSRPLAERVEAWRRATVEILRSGHPELRYELMDDGTLIAWEHLPGIGWKSKLPRAQSGPSDTP